METITQVEMKECTMCKIKKDNTLEFFYKGKNILRASCKTCSKKTTANNPNHNQSNLKSYYKYQEKNDARRMKLYVLNRTGVALAF